MARVVLDVSSRPEVLRLARAIVNAQRAEITQMRELLATRQAA